MIVPEDSAVAYTSICSELGYDSLGIPESIDDVKRFEEYLAGGNLGSIIVMSVWFN